MNYFLKIHYFTPINEKTRVKKYINNIKRQKFFCQNIGIICLPAKALIIVGLSISKSQTKE